jgi:hypothetical protein
MVIPEVCVLSTTYNKPQDRHRHEPINPLSSVLKYKGANGKDIEMDPNETTVKIPIEVPGKGIEKGESSTVVLDQQSLIRDFKDAT